jgi:hypothetical protein
MSRRQDIDELLVDWPFEPGAVNARLVHADDGREVIQMRIEMGLLQMEKEGRPDGEKPEGAETYLDYLVGESIRQSMDFELTPDQCYEVDREFTQFYHRRICWLALREFDRAIRDADHTLRLMDFAADHSPSDEWTLAHEQYRPFVLFHRTQASALAKLDGKGGEAAIEEINAGLTEIRRLFEEVDGEEEFEEDEMVDQLLHLQQWVRERYRVGRTLNERLADAVASEQYELAAQLRDEIARQQPRGR